MSFKLKYQSGSPVIATVYAYSECAKDSLVAIDGANNGVIPATSSTTELNTFGVAQDTITAGSYGRVVLLEPAQIWEGDCTNNTASTQCLNRHKLTNATTVANTTCDYDDSTAAVALMLRTVGAAADKKAEFLIVSNKQITA